MLGLMQVLFTPPTAREQGTAIGASAGMQCAVVAFRLTADPVMAALAGAVGTAFGAYMGSCRDLERIDAELERLRAMGYQG